MPKIYPTLEQAFVAIWVGIDGWGGSPTVQQCGIDVSNEANGTYAWVEMFPIPQMQLAGFPINTFDSISASVTYVGNNGYL